MDRRPGLVTSSVRHRISPDAVVIVPGIMGSVLESADGPLWGFDALRTYAGMWRRGHPALDALALTDRDGRCDCATSARDLEDSSCPAGSGRVRPASLLRFPAWTPFLQGFEPYTRLTDGARAVVAHPDAVLEFPYDWRLPVVHNARLLAIAAHAHLVRWRNHSANREMRDELPDLPPTRLVLVAHSMGGLLVRAIPLVTNLELDIRATVTLGTPFDGAAKSVPILHRGAGAPVPLPRRRLQKLAATLPGLHDLLPHYRCVDNDDADPRRLSPAEVGSLGGDRQLATDATEFHARTAALRLVGHHAVVGATQPTVQCLSLSDGVLTEHHHTFTPHRDGGFERDRHGVLVRLLGHGDGTVPDNSAHPTGVNPQPLAQQHGALAQTPEAIEIVRAVITGRDPDMPRLGDGEIGLSIPDIVAPQTEWPAVITGTDGPTHATCVVADADGRPIDHPPLHRRDGRWQATVELPSPGIYRVTVEGGGGSAVTQLVLADPGDGADG